jgi:hypothetical protein
MGRGRMKILFDVVFGAFTGLGLAIFLLATIYGVKITDKEDRILWQWKGFWKRKEDQSYLDNVFQTAIAKEMADEIDKVIIDGVRNIQVNREKKQ